MEADLLGFAGDGLHGGEKRELEAALGARQLRFAGTFFEPAHELGVEELEHARGIDVFTHGQPDIEEPPIAKGCHVTSRRDAELAFMDEHAREACAAAAEEDLASHGEHGPVRIVEGGRAIADGVLGRGRGEADPGATLRALRGRALAHAWREPGRRDRAVRGLDPTQHVGGRHVSGDDQHDVVGCVPASIEGLRRAQIEATDVARPAQRRPGVGVALERGSVELLHGQALDVVVHAAAALAEHDVTLGQEPLTIELQPRHAIGLDLDTA